METKSILKVVPLSGIRESTTNPRKHVDKTKQAELRDSIKAMGVVTPILVRPVNGYLELVDGFRRFHAAHDAGLTEVPAIVRELTDEAALEIQVTTNLQREDVHPLDESAGYIQLLKWYDVKTIAAKVSKSVSYVEKRLKLKDLVPDAVRMFYDDVLTVSHAIELARLQPKDQQKALKACIEPIWANRYSDNRKSEQIAIPLTKLQDWIKDNVLMDLRSVAFSKDDNSLLPKAGSCTECPKRTGFNTELFEEIAGTDRCTDGECFGKKMANFMKRQRESILEKTGKEPISITTERYSSKSGVLSSSNYTPAKTSDKDAVPAIIVAGGVRGKAVMIKVNKPQAEEESPKAKSLTAAQKAKQKARDRETLIEAMMEDRVAELMAKKVPGKLSDPADLLLLAEELDRGFYNTDVSQALGIKGALKKQTPATLIKFMLLGVCIGIDMPQQNILAIAERWGVDVKGLRKTIVAELTEKEKADKGANENGAATTGQNKQNSAASRNKVARQKGAARSK